VIPLIDMKKKPAVNPSKASVSPYTLNHTEVKWKFLSFFAKNKNIL
jgi:hypothetical protein